MATYKHFTLSDRIDIEHYLKDGLSFKAIGSEMNRDCTTIAKELKKRVICILELLVEHLIAVSIEWIAHILIFVITLLVSTDIVCSALSVIPYVMYMRKRVV